MVNISIMSEESNAYKSGGRISAGGAPPVVKYLVIANVLVFLVQELLAAYFSISIVEWFALFNFRSDKFQIYQLITHMFLHADIIHIFFNMFILWMFGSALETVWSRKRFLYYYFFTGVGAALLHLLISSFSLGQLEKRVEEYMQNPGLQNFQNFVYDEIGDLSSDNDRQQPFLRGINRLILSWQKEPGNSYYDEASKKVVSEYYQTMVDRPSIGASGAVFGILLAFGLLFPNVHIYIYFLFPLKAKYFVVILGFIELYLGLTDQFSNVANFAHLGGMLFGIILLKIWGIKSFKIE